MNVQYIRTNQMQKINENLTLTKWMGLDLAVDYWWMKPLYGNKINDIPSSLQLLVGEYQIRNQEKRFLVAIPAVNQTAKGHLITIDSDLYLQSVYGISEQNPVIGIIVTNCESILEGINAATQGLAQEIKSFKLREDKQIPAYYDDFGWCTWDVFYREVSEEKVLNCLEDFKHRQIKPAYMILDDGWQDVEGLYLNTISENSKFPSGLKQLATIAKTDYGMKQFGVWHALQGYWGGIYPQGKLAQMYDLEKNESIKESPYTTYFTDKGYYIQSEQIHHFYENFYQFLYESGIDLVKVDSQGSLMHLTENEPNQTKIMFAYQQALHTAGKKYFDHNVLYCMSHISDVIFNTHDFIAWRNSDDFFPDKPLDSQLEHFYVNAINNAFTSTFAYPDWDMFQTNHEHHELHALIRAISGGPFYICDAPKDVNIEILSKMIIHDHQTLRFKQPALPFEDCLIQDPLQTPTLLKVHNQSPFGLTIMSAHLNPELPSITEDLALNQFTTQHRHSDWVFFSHDLKQIGILASGQTLKQELSYADYTYLSFVPKYSHLTPLGNIDKYNAYLVISEIQISENQLTVKCEGKGTFAFLTDQETTIKDLFVNGITSNVSQQNQLLLINLQDSKNTIQVNF